MRTLTFVGGPEDGKRIAIAADPGPVYRVAVLPKLPSCAHIAESCTPIEVERFEYAVTRLRSPSHLSLFVAYPSEWDQDALDRPIELVIAALVNGYAGSMR